MNHLIGKRVQIPVHTDAWMQGDRYGEILHTWSNYYVTVKMDKSGRELKFYLDDVTFV